MDQNQNQNEQSPSTTAPVNLQAIYPTPTEHHSLGPNDPTNETPTLPFKRAFLKALLNFLSGLLLMAAVGLVIGAIFGQFAIRQSGYMSELATGVSFVLAIAPLTVAFGIVAYVRRDFSLLLYPFIAYMLAGGFAESSLSNFIYGSIPIHVPLSGSEKDTYRAFAIVPLMLAYVTTHSLIYPIRQLLGAASKPDVERRQAKLIYGIIAASVLVVVTVVGSVDESLYASQVRTREAVHLPDTAELASVAKLNTQETQPISLDFVDIIYQDGTKQRDGTYQQTDGMQVQPLAAWQQRDAKANCGTGVTEPGKRTNAAYYTYKKTESGVAYGEATLTISYNNYVSLGSGTYQEYHYCFVVGYQKYTLTRSNLLGDAYIQKYPATMVIDAIAKAPAYLPLCGSRGVMADDPSIPPVPYCTPADAAKINDHNTSNEKRYTQRRKIP